MTDDEAMIYGVHSVTEAVKIHKDLVKEVYVSNSAKNTSIIELAKENDINVQRFEPGSEPKGVEEDVVHQGVIARVAIGNLLTDYETFIEGLEITEKTCLVLLDEIQDPHNVGAIIRSAAAFGASAVLVPKHHQAPVSAVAIKSSAGMAFQLPLVEIGNINTTIRDLKERRFWVYGLDGKAEQMLQEEPFDAPTVIISGSEGAGIRVKTKELCDVLLRIPIDKKCESLNVSNASAITLYSWRQRHI